MAAPNGMTPARIAEARTSFRTLSLGMSIAVCAYVHGAGTRLYAMRGADAADRIALVLTLALVGAGAAYALWYWERRLYTATGRVAHRVLGGLVLAFAALALLVVGPYAAGIVTALGPVRVDTCAIVMMAGVLAFFLAQGGLVFVQDVLTDYVPAAALPPGGNKNATRAAQT
jgi:hypothetical protein